MLSEGCSMAERAIHQIDKQTWRKWSFYITIVIFIVIAISIYFLIIHSYEAGKLVSRSPSGDKLSQAWFYITADIAVLAVCLTYVFARLYSFYRTIQLRAW